VKVSLVTTLDRGGPVEQALLLGGELARRGVAVRAVCAFAAVSERFAAAGVDAVLVAEGSAADVRAAAATIRATRGSDVVHGHDRRANLWVRLARRPRRGGARVITVHGLPDPYHPPPIGQERPRLRARVAYEGLDAALNARVDAVVAPSQMIAGELVARLRYPERKVVVVPNGIALPAFAPDRGGEVGMLALLVPLKGADLFLRAAAQLRQTHPELRFAIFGDGPQRPRLTGLRAELGLDDVVAMPGFVPSAQALARLQVLVIASYAENAPMALLEAMGAGVAVVTTDVGGIPEIADERTARLVAPGDPDAIATAVAGLLADGAARAAQVRAARARVEERFTAQRNADGVLAVYERALGTGAAP
jgi:glycosyltransferase involved in cell wall biosynthesis